MPRGGFAPLKRAHRNWNGEQNPFNMAQPPEAFLRWLHDYDAELLLLPGLTEPVYRLARRSPSSKKLKAIARDSETRRMIRVGAIPIVSLARVPDWERVKLWVQQADTWAAGGAEKFANRLEESERAAAQRQQATQDDEAMQRAISGWHGWKFRTGQAAFVQGTPRPTQEVDQPSALHGGPGLGDIADGSLPSKPAPGERTGAAGHAQAEDPGTPQGAVRVPRTAQGES